MIRRGEVSDDGGRVSVSGSVVSSGDFGNTTTEGDKDVAKVSVRWEAWSSCPCMAVAVMVVVEPDLFLMLRLAGAGECGTDGRDNVSEEIGEDTLEITCVGAMGVCVSSVNDSSSVVLI